MLKTGTYDVQCRWSLLERDGHATVYMWPVGEVYEMSEEEAENEMFVARFRTDDIFLPTSEWNQNSRLFVAELLMHFVWGGYVTLHEDVAREIIMRSIIRDAYKRDAERDAIRQCRLSESLLKLASGVAAAGA